MDASALFTVTQTLLQLIDSRLAKEIEKVWGFKSQLDKLKSTISTITAVLGEADKLERQQLGIDNLVDRDWLHKLKEEVYQANDLLEEVAYVDQHKQLMSGNKSKEVRLFFSRFNQPAFAFNVYRGIKKIRESLDDIAKDRRDFGSRLSSSAASGDGGLSRRIELRDVRSFVQSNDIVGRDGDKRVVMEMLSDPNDQDHIRFVTIVGIGGLGKTTLANLIYDDVRIKQEFPLKLWVCVSEEFDLRAILCQLLEAQMQNQPIHQLQSKVRTKLEGRKFLLVLDDVWNEDPNTWSQLKDLVTGGAKGSRVVVTTRSKLVAEIVGDSSTHIELKGLSPQDSRRLFIRMAFRNEHEVLDDEFAEMVDHFIKKCSYVPLAIRVVGSLLYCQHKSMWKTFIDMNLASIEQNKDNGIGPVLKLSYYHLEPHLRRCFTYCALFPKDYEINKTVLINLWMAHGFIKPLQGQSLEDAGEQCFMALLQRCFFQEVVVDNVSGDITSCKMHDLMHDVAVEVAKAEIMVVTSDKYRFDKNIRHLFVTTDFSNEAVGSFVNKLERLHTVFLPYGFFNDCKRTAMRSLLSGAISLRVLCLRYGKIKRFPNTIDKLTHLRFLDLSGSWDLKYLPTSFVKLYNLQTLLLCGCRKLIELPRDFNKLANLRHLDLHGCYSLTHMPPGMNEMTRLQTLTLFVAGGRSNCSSSMGSHVGQLEDLAVFTNLKGTLEVRVQSFNAARVKEVGYILRSMERLTNTTIAWGNESSTVVDGVSLLESLQPHSNVRSFCLENYPGEGLPSWASSKKFGASLPKLVKLEIKNCRGLQELPLLSQLQHLTFLCISNLGNVEYVENSSRYDDDTYAPSSSSTSSPGPFFPSLERLELEGMEKLKGWLKPISGAHQQRNSSVLPSFAFPRLSKLKIWGCPDVTSIPLPPTLEELLLWDAFSHSVLSDSSSTDHDATATGDGDSHSTWKLKRVEIDRVEVLNYLPRECFSCLSELKIWYSKDESLSKLEETSRRWLSVSLQSLLIACCERLRSIVGGGLEHLTCLERLELHGLREVEEMEDMNEMPWKSFHRNLRHLKIKGLPKLVNLPRGIKYLTSLQSLYICDSSNLEALPQEMTCLTSLQSLSILCCPLLQERCKEPTGEDWPKIQHIPNRSLDCDTPSRKHSWLKLGGCCK